jgi:hypothetical protein
MIDIRATEFHNVSWPINLEGQKTPLVWRHIPDDGASRATASDLGGRLRLRAVAREVVRVVFTDSRERVVGIRLPPAVLDPLRAHLTAWVDARKVGAARFGTTGDDEDDADERLVREPPPCERASPPSVEWGRGRPGAL